MNHNIASSRHIDFLLGGGEMGERIRSFNWADTLLGPVDKWPQSLQSALSICIHSNFPIAIYWGADLVLLYNNAWSPIPGNKHPWALGRPAKEVWPEIWNDIGPLFQEAFENNIATGSKDGLLPMERHGYIEECYFDFTFTPIYGEKGKVEGIFNAVIETTYRVINERRAAVLQKLNIAINALTTIEEVVTAASAILNDAKEDVPFFFMYTTSHHSEPFLSSGSSENSEVVMLKDWPFQDVMLTGSSKLIQDLELYLTQIPYGYWPEAPKEALLLPLKGSDGGFIGFLVAGISSRRKFDKEYQLFFESIAASIGGELNTIASLYAERKRAEALAEIDRAKTTFFSNISHEFRTPLTLMLGPLEELLDNEQSLQENVKENLKIAHRNTIRLQKLVNTLLDFSKIEAGRMQANFTTVDICSFTQDLASSFRAAIEKAGLKLEVKCEKIHAEVFVDPEMWEKIVLNLISNAFKYSLEGSIQVTIKQVDQTVELAVSDTGTGIPENELDKIFDRFHRATNTMGRSQEGTGIGLAMVKELVKLHHGWISVTSRHGVGSTFTVSLPLSGAHVHSLSKDNAVAKPSMSQQSKAYVQEALQWSNVENASDQSYDNTLHSGFSRIGIGPGKKTYTVLLADDNADMRRYIERLLGPYFKVIAVADGEQAFTKALENTPDLILTDIMMPKLDGFGLLKKLKTSLSTRYIPVIFLSARAGDEAKVEGLLAGADDYLTKPFSSKELLARVSNHLAISSVRRQTEKEFFNLFMQSPAHIHVFKGAEHVVDFFHPLGIPFAGRDITGMKIREALPQLEGQGFFEMLDKVYNEGVVVHNNNAKAVFKNENGNDREHYFDITYLPWRDLEGKVQGVLQFTFEVTETIEQRLRAEANERKFRSIAQQAPVAMAVLKGPSHIIEVANDRVLEMWGKKYDEVINRSVLQVFPEIVDQGLGEILGNVFKTGVPFVASEMPVTFMRKDVMEQILVNLLYEPFRNENNEIEGIVAVGTDVTEQVLARNKVAEAELKFRMIIEQTPSPLCIFKGEEMILEVANDAALAVWQVGEDVIGKRLVDIVPEMIQQPFNELMLDVYRNGVTRHGYEAPAYFIRKTGEKEERFFNFIYVPYRNVDGSISGVLVLATDVTGQVHAKKQLIENEERLRIATEILELGTWEYDPASDIIYCSEKTIELFGFSAGTQIKLSEAVNLIIDEDKQRVADAVRWALNPQSNGKYDVEYSLTNATDKKLRTIRANGQVFFDTNHIPYRFLGTALDITERKKAEVEIKASEARFRLLATSIPQIVWTNDKDGNTSYISNQFEKFTGQKPDLFYQTWHNLIHPDDVEKYVANRGAAIKNGDGWRVEFRLLDTIRGVYRWFSGNSQPLKDANGNIIMWIGSATDIQDLKEQSSWLETQVQERTRALKELNQSLKLSNEDLQQFAHVASHDLKEPIRKIKTYSNRLQDDYKDLLPEKGNVFLNKIISAIDRMYAMIDGVLSYSTMASADQPTETVDLNEVIKSIQTDLEILIHEKKAVIKAERLPMIEGAPVLLYQLFYNLINNSIKFSKSDEAPVIIIQSAVASLEDNQFAKIVLSDNGIGFDQAYAERIFATFTRLNSKDKYEGTGLGLALCKKIVHRHGGFISAKGEKNKGAEFTVLLPIKESSRKSSVYIAD